MSLNNKELDINMLSSHEEGQGLDYKMLMFYFGTMALVYAANAQKALTMSCVQDSAEIFHLKLIIDEKGEAFEVKGASEQECAEQLYVVIMEYLKTKNQSLFDPLSSSVLKH